jgi:hypothetical protein
MIYHNTTSEFYTADNALTFSDNKHKLGPQWRFYSLPITYKINSHGYRMNKQLDEIDYNNYIAFFGCSFTVGVGLPLEETYAYRIAGHYGLGDNYINAAVGGSSPSFVVANMVHMFKNVPRLPKAIIVNWPPLNRIHYWYKDRLTFMSTTLRTGTFDHKYWQRAFEDTVLETSHMINSSKGLVDTVTTLCKISGVKLFQFSSMHPITHDSIVEHCPDVSYVPFRDLQYTEEEINTIDVINRMKARDIHQTFAHPGIYHQDRVVEASISALNL